MSDQNWGLFANHHFRHVPTFAAEVVKKTAKTVTFRRYKETKLDGVEASEQTRKLDALLVEGLSRASAERAAELDQSSVALRQQEHRASEDRHQARRAKIIADARQPKDGQ